MPIVHTLPLGDYQTNCYIVHAKDAASCAIIDPGYEPETILTFLKQKGLTLDAILLTHGHFDHVGGVKAILAATGCDLYLHRGDFDQPDDPMSRFCYPLAGAALPGLRFAEDGDSVTAGGLTFRILSTPGHTKGSVCFQCEDVLFSGDTLFAGAIGRTDHPGGDYDQLMKSIFEKLICLDGDVAVIPGHGPDSSIADERMTNPFLLPFNEPYES